MDDVEFAVRATDEASDPTEQMAAAFLALSNQLQELNQSADVTNHYLDSMADSAKNAKQPVEDTTLSMSDLNQGLEVVNKALGYAQQAYDETIGKSQAYAEQVQSLSAISGQSAENTSRFIQVLDDWGVSAEDAEGATRKLTSKGLAPNLDTLANLSDRYLEITDVQERNKFVIDNLGKSGLQWNKVLEQGGTALREQSAAVSGNLVLTDKQLKQAEQLRLAQDQLDDTLEGLKITVGTGLTPAFSAWVEVANRFLTGSQKLHNEWYTAIPFVGALIGLTQDYGDAANELQSKIPGVTKATEDNTAADLHAAEAKQAADDAAKALSETYTTELQLAQSLQGQTDSYADSVRGLRDQQSELEDKIANTPAWETDKIQGYKDKLDEIPGKIQEVEAKYAESMAKIAYDNLIAKLSVGGLTDAEFEMAQKAGVSLGIFTQSTADQAVALNSLTSALAEGKITQQEFDQAIKDGSLNVGDSNKSIITGYDEVSRTVKTKTDEAAVSAGKLGTSAVEAKDATTTALSDSKKAWEDLTTHIQDDVAKANSYIDEYIQKLNQIPATVRTQLVPSASGAAGDLLVS